MPLLAPVIETVKQLSRYTDAEVSAAVIDSFFAAAVSSKAGEPTIEPAMTEDEQIDGSNDNTLELANGTILELNEGEEITPINPSRPNNAFDGFVLSLSRYIGSAIGLPFELLVKHFTASYSASRAALLEAWKGFRVGREFMIENFCQPVYEQWLAEAVAMGHVSAPGFWGSPLAQAAWTRAQWHGPSQGQLDPLKEVKAAEQRVSGGFSTRTREAAELTGTDWEENHKVRDREENLRRSAGLTERPEPDTTGDEGSPDEPHRRE
jgi:lambda family phage portal protein